MTEEYWKILTKTIDWVKYSDAKAAVMLTVYGIIISAAFSNIDEFYSFVFQSWSNILLTSIAAILSLISAGYSFVVLNPRLIISNPNSIIFYGHIQEKFSTSEDYFLAASKIINNKEEYEKQLAEQIFINSKVAWKKFKYVAISIRLFAAAICVLFLESMIYMLA